MISIQMEAFLQDIPAELYERCAAMLKPYRGVSKDEVTWNNAENVKLYQMTNFYQFEDDFKAGERNCMVKELLENMSMMSFWITRGENPMTKLEMSNEEACAQFDILKGVMLLACFAITVRAKPLERDAPLPVNEPQMTHRAFLDKPLAFLGLPSQIYKPVVAVADYIGELVQLTDKELRAVAKIGPGRRITLKSAIHKHGWDIGCVLPDWQRPDAETRPKLNGVPLSARMMTVLRMSLDSVASGWLYNHMVTQGWMTIGDMLADPDHEQKLESPDVAHTTLIPRLKDYSLKLGDRLEGWPRTA